MRAAVLGVNGYIGQHLAHFLLQQGWIVQGYDIADSSALPGIEYASLDTRDSNEYKKLGTDFDFIFYFSGVTGTIKGYEDYERYIDVNEKGLMHLLARIRTGTSRPRVVFPSTRLVYKGIRGVALGEEAEKEFKTVYALNKWFGENVLRQYAAYFNMPYTIFRICVPYGNLLSNTYSYGTVGFFLSKAAAGDKIALYGDGGQQRSFTHVEDICRQIYYCLLQPGSANEVFNIAGETYSLKQIADVIGRKYSIGVEFVPWPEIDEKLESGDTIFDPARISKMIKNPLQNSFDKWLETIG
jgi:UDP-glucose 4-epimerase